MRGLRMRKGRAPVATVATWATVAVLALGAGGCDTADDSKLPPNVPDPASIKTPAGAMARYLSARSLFASIIDRAMSASGIITDELGALRSVSLSAPARYAPVDARLDFSVLSANTFGILHQARAQAREARGFLASYAPDSSLALQGYLYAIEGYADIYLADLFCSGIPLSTVNFDGSYTLAAGSTTAQVYTQAAALFDSATALSADSTAFQLLAAVGKGRALLALGRYTDAAAAVAGVPDDYAMKVPFYYTLSGGAATATNPVDSSVVWYFGRLANQFAGTAEVLGVADHEGGNGLDYRTSLDPRTAVVAVGAVASGDSMYFPAKYLQGHFDGGVFADAGTDTFRVASGIEARLIEAEAALRGGGDWLGILNHLRQTAWPSIVPAPSGPLSDLTDPGTDTARVNMLFRERAFWLFLTGHRQGDLRRLIRQYSYLPGYLPDQVYPIGPFFGGGGITNYGDKIVVPVPQTEQNLNPKYTGCINGDA